jgi:hypothetical protein
MLKRTPLSVLNELVRPPKPPTRHMQAKWSVARGRWGFYFNVRKEESKLPGCPVRSQELGDDLEEAQRKVDKVLQPQLVAWRAGRDAAEPIAPEYGTLDWLKAAFYKTRFFLGEEGERGAAPTDPATGQRILLPKHVNRQWHIDEFADFKFIDSRRLGAIKLLDFTAKLREALLPALLHVVETDKKTGEQILRQRRTTRNKMFRYVRAMWNHMQPLHEELFPKTSPFMNMRLKDEYGDFPAATHEELESFVDAADQLGHPSVGNAALVGWEWAQRKKAILTSLDASDYRPANARHFAFIEHGKTDEFVWVALRHHDDNARLFPELEARLDRAKMNRSSGPLIFRDHVWRETGKIEPWVSERGSETGFDKVVAKIMKEAKLRPELSFGSFRQGGLTEMGEAELTEAEIMHLSRHKNAFVLRRYLKRTAKVISNGQRKRRNFRNDRTAGHDAILLKTLPNRRKVAK